MLFSPKKVIKPPEKIKLSEKNNQTSEKIIIKLVKKGQNPQNKKSNLRKKKH